MNSTKIGKHEVFFLEDNEAGFIQKWFGFNGWNTLSTRGSIMATIFYRVFFVLGLALAIVAYSYASGGGDLSSLDCSSLYWLVPSIPILLST